MCSAPVQVVTCTGCNFRQNTGTFPLTVVYQLLDGREAVWHCKEAWCHQCQSIQGVEELADIGILTDEIAKESLKSKGGWSGHLKNAFGLRPSRQQRAAQREVVRLETVLSWRRSRRSPPHCLTCGSTRWHELDWTSIEGANDGKVFDSLTRQFRHDCGGNLRQRVDFRKLIHFRPMQLVLSSEGQLLSEQECDGNDALHDFVSDLVDRNR